VRGTLGNGYGNIGTQLAVIAEAMGMRVIYYDHTDKLRHGNVEPADSLDELLAKADIVTMHVPETPATQGMIGAREISAMKKGAIFINNARGTVVDLDALATALKSNHLSGAAVDVFPVEPSSNAEKFASPLQGLDNVILTPHVGGSTEEAQERIGAEVARQFVEYSDVGSTTAASISAGAAAAAAGRHAFHPGAAQSAGRLGRLNGCSRTTRSTSPRSTIRPTASSASCSMPTAGCRRRGHRARSAPCPAPSAPACCIGGRSCHPGRRFAARETASRFGGSRKRVPG
jgi:D-3-phosphoglycerate dehydrogenase